MEFVPKTKEQVVQMLVESTLKNWNMYPKLMCKGCGALQFYNVVEAVEVSSLDPANHLGSTQVVNRNVLVCKGCGIYIALTGPKMNVEKVEVEKN